MGREYTRGTVLTRVDVYKGADAGDAGTQHLNTIRSDTLVCQVWDNPATLALSSEAGVWEDAQEIPANMTYVVDGNFRGATIKNKEAGDAARYEISFMYAE